MDWPSKVPIPSMGNTIKIVCRVWSRILADAVEEWIRQNERVMRLRVATLERYPRGKLSIVLCFSFCPLCQRAGWAE